MDVSWWLVVGAVFVCVVVLTSLCLNCGTKGPLVSISQTTDEEYIQSPNFRVIHQYPHSVDPVHSSVHHPSSSLHPTLHPTLSPSLNIPTRHHSFLTENESNPSYENPPDAADYVNTDDSDAEGYVKVLPDKPAEIHQSRSSLASTHSSVDVEPAYVNVDPNEKVPRCGSGDYLNVDPLNPLTPLNPLKPLKACDPRDPRKRSGGKADYCNELSDSSDDEDDDDDDDDGNYVNQPAIDSR